MGAVAGQGPGADWSSLPSPKVGPAGAALDSWYRYYAGYSAAFVEDVLRRFDREALLVDPWNGTGTTTVMAARDARAARGYDANPALVVIAKARLLGASVAASINALAADIEAHATRVDIGDDPLLGWFDAETAAHLRGLQTSTHRLLVTADDAEARPLDCAGTMSSLAAFFYVALFRAARLLAAPAAGTNPTWWKRRRADAVLAPGAATAREAFRSASRDLLAGLHGAKLDGPLRTSVHVGDSRRLPLADDAAGGAITSPPYCTRIDYPVATSPELAVLRATDEEVRTLRDKMVGTPTMTGRRGSPEQWGAKAAAFLDAVHDHPSRASDTYYLAYFEQYYDAMWDSLRELRRVCAEGSPVVMVVQDSHYKNVHNDTPGILGEMAALAGFSDVERHDFPIPRTRAAMNPRSRPWRRESTAVESVLVLT